jgi:hypothetical protein
MSGQGATSSVDYLDLLRAARRAAADLRKVFLAVYGLLIVVPLVLLLVAAGRAALFGEFFGQIGETVLWPVQSTADFFLGAFAEGLWGLMALVVLGAWLIAILVGSFFGLAVTRMTAIELTSQRRAEVSEALRFAGSHWHWAFLTPAALLLGAALLLVVGALVMALGRVSGYLLLIAAPCAFLLVLGAVILLLGLLAGGLLSWPAIATEWSDAFDAVTRIYGYSFSHAHRLILYRLGAGIAMLGAVATRGFRVLLVLGGLFLVLRLGMGKEGAWALVDAVLLERPQGLPLPQSVAGWVLLTCVAIFLTLILARLLVFGLALRQAIYMLLRLRVDKVPLDNIDGYRPDDSDYDPTAQGFELVEVEEEIASE